MTKTDYPRLGTRQMCAYYKKEERKAEEAQSRSYWHGCHAVSKIAEQDMRHLVWATTSDH